MGIHHNRLHSIFQQAQPTHQVADKKVSELPVAELYKGGHTSNKDGKGTLEQELGTKQLSTGEALRDKYYCITRICVFHFFWDRYYVHRKAAVGWWSALH